MDPQSLDSIGLIDKSSGLFSDRFFLIITFFSSNIQPQIQQKTKTGGSSESDSAKNSVKNTTAPSTATRSSMNLKSTFSADSTTTSASRTAEEETSTQISTPKTSLLDILKLDNSVFGKTIFSAANVFGNLL